MDNQDQESVFYKLLDCDLVSNMTCQKMMREFNRVCDVVASGATMAYGGFSLSTGSRMECSCTQVGRGKDAESSDRDEMLVPYNIYVYRSEQDFNTEMVSLPLAQTAKLCLVVEASSIQRPGFVKLRVVFKDEKLRPTSAFDTALFKSLVSKDSRLFLSSEDIMRNLFAKQTSEEFYSSVAEYQNKFLDTTVIKQDIHGPAIASQSVTTANTIPSDRDKVLALTYRYWPQEASEWRTRVSKTGWPSMDTKSEIIIKGCHVVATGNVGSPENALEWRISFSIAEQKLFETMNDTQLKSHLLLKILLKEYIQPLVPSSLNSYHMKTLIFWSAESDEAIVWEGKNLVRCIGTMLQKLITWIKAMDCKHYFIPLNNLFLNKVTPENQTKLLYVVSELHQNLWQRLQQSKSLGLVPLGKSVSSTDLQRAQLAIISTTKDTLMKEFISFSQKDEMMLVQALMENYTFLGYKVSETQHYMELLQSLLKYKNYIDVLDRNFKDQLQVSWQGKLLQRLKFRILQCLGTSCFAMHFMDSFPVEVLAVLADDTKKGANALQLSEKYLLESLGLADCTNQIWLAIFYIQNGQPLKALPLLDKASTHCKEQNFEKTDFVRNRQYFKYKLIQQGFDLGLINDVLQDLKLVMPKEDLNNPTWPDLKYLDCQSFCNVLITKWIEGQTTSDFFIHFSLRDCLPQFIKYELLEEKIPYRSNQVLHSLPSYPWLQFWHSSSLIRYLKFLCYFELDDKNKLDDLLLELTDLTNMKRVAPDDVSSVLNMTCWCCVKMANYKEAIPVAILAVQMRRAWAKNAFTSHFIIYVLSVIYTAYLEQK